MIDLTTLVDNLKTIGLKKDQIVIVHTAYKSLGITDPEYHLNKTGYS